MEKLRQARRNASIDRIKDHIGRWRNLEAAAGKDRDTEHAKKARNEIAQLTRQLREFECGVDRDWWEQGKPNGGNG